MVLSDVTNMMAACKVEEAEDGSCVPPNTPKLQLVRQTTPKPFVRPLTWAPVKKPPPHDPNPIPVNSTAKRTIKFD